jgi:hypothetical protein
MRQSLLVCFLLAAILGVVIPSYAQETSDCGLPARLIVGHEGRVLYDNILNVRSEPGLGGVYIRQISSGGMFTVLDGPRCLDGYNWWQIDYHHVSNNLIGWAAEGDAALSEYWLEPRGQRVLITEVNGAERYYVITADGTTEPEGCLQPTADYTRVWVGSAQLNARTLLMLDHAGALYAAQGGEDNLRARITQGSYTGGAEPASFGTHDGGGAVDLSMRDTIQGGVLADVETLVYSLRVAGFAAWLRDEGLFYPNSPVHIHAIALGDQELSEAAQLQIDGSGGYLNGLDGLLPTYGGPSPDPHGGPVICHWMQANVAVEATG